jgi:hypothetical protein
VLLTDLFVVPRARLARSVLLDRVYIQLRGSYRGISLVLPLRVIETRKVELLLVLSLRLELRIIEQCAEGLFVAGHHPDLVAAPARAELVWHRPVVHDAALVLDQRVAPQDIVSRARFDHRLGTVELY